MAETPKTDESIEARHMQCLEVWGGNVATNTAFVMPGLDAWIYSKPFADPNIQTENHTEDAGGDIHYLSSCATGRISRLLVADVAGHGKSVAKVTSTLASLLRKHSNQVNMTRFVHGLNREFVAHSEAGIFATAVAATYWAPTNQMILCNAGHPKPLLYRSKTGAWEFIVGEALAQPVNAPHQPNNVPLGITDLVSYTATTVNMEPGDLMLLYTDSMIEARSPFGEFIGQQGLVNLMNTLDPNPTSLIPSLLAKLNEFRGGADDNDDVTAMLLRSTSFSQSRVSQTALAGMTMGRALVDKLLHPDKPFPRLEMSDGIKKLKDLGFARPELLTLRDITS